MIVQWGKTTITAVGGGDPLYRWGPPPTPHSPSAGGHYHPGGLVRTLIDWTYSREPWTLNPLLCPVVPLWSLNFEEVWKVTYTVLIEGIKSQITVQIIDLANRKPEIQPYLVFLVFLPYSSIEFDVAEIFISKHMLSSEIISNFVAKACYHTPYSQSSFLR